MAADWYKASLCLEPTFENGFCFARKLKSPLLQYLFSRIFSLGGMMLDYRIDLSAK